MVYGGFSKSSMKFFCEVLDSAMAEMDITLLTSDDEELVKLLDYSKSKLSVVFQRMNNFYIRREASEGQCLDD